MSGKEMKLECRIVELKSKIRYFANVVESVSTSLLQEQVKGNEDVATARDRLRDIVGIMRSES